MKINPINLLKQVGQLPFKLVDIKFEGGMDNEKRKKKANSIVRNHIIWSMGTGLIPIPVLDFFAVSAVQLDMVRQLSKLYGVDFKETEGKAVITSLTGSGLAQLGARAAMKLIPGVGTVIGGVTMSVLSGASTYALGEIFKEHFETGGTFLDFDPGRLRKYYQEKFEKGKQVARDIREEEERKKKEGKSSGGFKVRENQPEPEENLEEEHALFEDENTSKNEAPVQEEKATDNGEISQQDKIVTKIKELANLRDNGILTEEEFQLMKAKVLEKF